jgi:hypothetical protein
LRSGSFAAGELAAMRVPDLRLLDAAALAGGEGDRGGLFSRG